jgi:ATP-dependent DNA helicase RecG
MVAIARLREDPGDEPVSVRVTVTGLTGGQTFRRRVVVTTARLRDDAGDEAEATWYGRRFIDRRLHVGDRIVLTGRVKPRGWLPRFESPEFGPDLPGALHAGRIVPVYRLTAGVTHAWLRRAMRIALDRIEPDLADYLPRALLDRLSLPGLAEALESAHYPGDFPARDAALRRLAFDELLALQIGMIARDRQRRPDTAQPVTVTDERLAEAIAIVEQVVGEKVRARLAGSDDPDRRAASAAFDVRLTPDQRTAVDHIRDDLASTRPMLRLLQGDVGSGKTAVAALALAFVADAGRQGALLAPTDLLARQHAATLEGLLRPLGHGVTLLTGSLSPGERRRALQRIGDYPETPGLLDDGGAEPLPSAGRVVVGTHALFQDAARFRDLGLVIVDEQHRFGVGQRDALTAKGRTPHVLLMTATPIPRTLGQVFHADLDVTDLRTAPVGRRPVATGRRRFDELGGRPDDPSRGTYRLIASEVAAGRRAFVVVPLVEEDEASEALAVGEARDRLGAELPAAARAMRVDARAIRIGIVHGQMPAAERDATMDAFRRGDVTVLVGTTVVEVGVDVPEATVMAILNAERFGVAQLHQLRGRVGRGEWRSYCILVSDVTAASDPVGDARLEAIVGTADGFELAEVDFRLREAGDLLGELQSGLPPLRVASLVRQGDRDLSVLAREEAARMVDADGRLHPAFEALGAQLQHGWLAAVGAGEALADRPDDDDADRVPVAPPEGRGTGVKHRGTAAPAGTVPDA